MVSNNLDINLENEDWGLFVDIEKYENDTEKNIYKKKSETYLRNNMESQIYRENYDYKNNKNNKNIDNELFYCLTNTIITSCLTWVVLCVL
jgi:hypothetical protein